MNTPVAVIGGTGMDQWPGLAIEERRTVQTPFGAPSSSILIGRVYGVRAAFLARHGESHGLAPHQINYRANLWALNSVGVKAIVAIAAVGAISPKLPPGAIAAPRDLIDYTYGRMQTYFDGIDAPLQHIEFSDPYSASVRNALVSGALAAGVQILDDGVVGVTQGPRLETPAEIRRLTRDGCDMVGMTSMPEACLARELAIAYGSLALSVNWAAGIGSGDIHGEIQASIERGMTAVRQDLEKALPALIAGF